MSSSFGGAPAPASAGVPGPAGSTSAPAERTPSAIGYWIAGVIIVVGSVAALIWFVSGISNLFSAVDTYPRVAVPGQVTAPLEAASYKVFAEYPGASADVSGVFRVGDVTVVDSSGSSIPVRSSFAEETYDWNGHEGRAIAEFTAPTAGTYTVAATVSRTPSATSVRVAVGRGLQRSDILPLFAAAGLGGFAVLAGIVLIVVTAVRRGRAKRRALPTPAFAGAHLGGYPGAPGGPGAYGQWGAPPQPGAGQGWGAPAPPPTGQPYPPYQPPAAVPAAAAAPAVPAVPDAPAGRGEPVCLPVRPAG